MNPSHQRCISALVLGMRGLPSISQGTRDLYHNCAAATGYSITPPDFSQLCTTMFAGRLGSPQPDGDHASARIQLVAHIFQRVTETFAEEERTLTAIDALIANASTGELRGRQECQPGVGHERLSRDSTVAVVSVVPQNDCACVHATQLLQPHRPGLLAPPGFCLGSFATSSCSPADP